MKRLAVLLVAAGCAKGGGGTATDATPANDAPQADAPTADSPTTVDAPQTADAMIDAPMIDAMIDAPMIDAMIDAPMIDAPMIDAPCVPVNTELLVNGAFDATPIGTGWSETRIDPAYPLVTPPAATNPLATQAGPYYAWLGGFESTAGLVTDVLYQNVTVPANTTQLRITGYYFVGSDESATTTSVYDTGVLALTQLNNTPYTTVLSLSNRSETTAWQAFDHTFVQNLSGQTVRLRMTTSNDISNATSFWFDTLSLVATHCP
jgi:hypothetical protein